MKTLLAVSALAIFSVLLVTFATPCSIDYQIPVFTYHRHPDFPRTEFLAGHLGVLQPTYARSYLYVAYRYLNGVGLNPSEREQVRLYWTDRLTGAWDGTNIDWEDRWSAARKRIPGAGSPPKMSPGPEPGVPVRYTELEHFWVLNCADDAFRTAILTLQDRSSRFGRTNPYVKDWLRAQDVVFTNCFAKGDSFPAPAPNDAPPWLRADRAYQLAAAQLYTGRREAETSFRRIASDTSSPWRWIAPYLVARVVARQAEESGATKAPPAARAALYEKARMEIETILADPKLSQIRGMSSALLRRIRARVRPQLAVRELAQAVMRRGDQGSLRQDLWEYTTLLDHFLDFPWYRDVTPDLLKESATLPRQDEITDWIVTFQSKTPWDTAHAIKRWRDTGRLPWLIASLTHVTGKNAAADDLLEASRAIPRDSCAFWTAGYHRNRLRVEMGDKAGARAEMESLVEPPPSELGKSGANHFRALQMLAAPNLQGFLRFGQRVPLVVTSEWNFGETPGLYGNESEWKTKAEALPKKDEPPQWNRDAVKVLNDRTPLSFWIEAARSDQIADHARQELVLATFARATLLDDDSATVDLAPDVSKAFPGGKQFMSDLLSESTVEGRHFAAVNFLLHHANIRPYLTLGMNWRTPSAARMDSFFNNWWCAVDAPHEIDWDTNRTNQMRIPSYPKDPDATGNGVAFLSSDEVLRGKEEFAKLAATGPAPNYMGAEVLKWAQLHPSDPRIPEALAYVVRAGKYGCTDSETWKFSRDAHVLLRSKYANTPWARRTPFWYKTWMPTW